MIVEQRWFSVKLLLRRLHDTTVETGSLNGFGDSGVFWCGPIFWQIPARVEYLTYFMDLLGARVSSPALP